MAVGESEALEWPFPEEGTNYFLMINKNHFFNDLTNLLKRDLASLQMMYGSCTVQSEQFVLTINSSNSLNFLPVKAFYYR